jgi:hypothetical protein
MAERTAYKEYLGTKPRYTLDRDLRDIEKTVGTYGNLGYARARRVFRTKIVKNKF